MENKTMGVKGWCADHLSSYEIWYQCLCVRDKVTGKRNNGRSRYRGKRMRKRAIVTKPESNSSHAIAKLQ